ncbi:MAG: hypothetical protein AAF721_20585, partial [Myxococcota bacterium]
MRISISVSLDSSSGEEGVNSADIPPPEVFYVVVGRGPGAVINSTTLRGADAGRTRIGTRKVVHVGFANPWPKYLQHGMGQPGYLLTLPGFARQPNEGAAEVDGGLDSRAFGAAVDRQMAKLEHDTETSVLAGWLAWVQAKANPDALPDEDGFGAEQGGADVFGALEAKAGVAKALNNWPESAEYRLYVVTDTDLTVEVVYASHIDFCTGPGRPNAFGGGPAIKAAKTAPWLAPELWDEALENRRVLNGVDAIVSTVRFAANERICVTAGGGVGLNGAEKARNNNCWLDWFGRS